MDELDGYLLDLCDGALGEAGERGAELAWLREGGTPEGPPARVDAWYPQARLVVLLTDTGGGERARTLARMAAAFGVDVMEVRRAWVARDADGRPRRLLSEPGTFAEYLADPEEREHNKVWPEGSLFAMNVAASAYPDDEDWPDDDFVPYEEEDRDDEPADPVAMQPETELDRDLALGWRGRAVALALLEAVRLARRALAVERTGPGLPEEALEVLLVLFVAGAPVEPDEVAGVLARPEDEAADLLAYLQQQGHAEPTGVGVEHPGEPLDWVVTETGREVVTDWIARAAPLLAGWPPDVPGVDDAAGPAPG